MGLGDGLVGAATVMPIGFAAMADLVRQSSLGSGKVLLDRKEAIGGYRNGVDAFFDKQAHERGIVAGFLAARSYFAPAACALAITALIIHSSAGSSSSNGVARSQEPRSTPRASCASFARSACCCDPTDPVRRQRVCESRCHHVSRRSGVSVRTASYCDKNT
jgi:hypothetical protein